GIRTGRCWAIRGRHEELSLFWRPGCFRLQMTNVLAQRARTRKSFPRYTYCFGLAQTLTRTAVRRVESPQPLQSDGRWGNNGCLQTTVARTVGVMDHDYDPLCGVTNPSSLPGQSTPAFLP